MKCSFHVAAVMAVIFLGSTLAEAIDFKFGAQIRPRYSLIDHKGPSGFNDTYDPEQVWESRVRFGTTITLNENNSGFIQLQGIGIWGSEDIQRSGFFPSDAESQVGFHQAYFTVKNVYDIPLELQVGRQELVLDGHRLIGNVGWSTGGRSHDGIRLVHAKGNFKLLYMYTKLIEADHAFGSSTDADPDDDFDYSSHFLWANFKGLVGEKSSTSLYFIYLDIGNFDTIIPEPLPPGFDVNPKAQDNKHFTIGLRQAGRLLGIDYRGEFYYQFGTAETYANSSRAPANPNLLGYADYDDFHLGAGSGIDRSAYMFGFRVGKRFSKVPWKPSFTVWYDHLSGTDQDDVNSKRFSTFGTMFASQHKFYGNMDLFYAGGSFFQAGQSVAYLGLRDLAIKGSIHPHKKLLINLAYHWFWTDTDLSDPANAALKDSILTVPEVPDEMNPMGPPLVDSFVIDCLCRPKLGGELDITLVHRYNDWLTFSIGYSRFFSATPLFRHVRSVNDLGLVVENTDQLNDSDWAFAQFDWKF